MEQVSVAYTPGREVHIGGVVLGRAPVKILASVCAQTLREMVHQGCAIEGSCADILEWRADYYEDAAPWQEAVNAMRAFVTKPILYTFRSAGEGGVSAPISDAEWRQKVLEAIASGLFDAVDVEYNREGFRDVLAAAKAARVPAILSWHSFEPVSLKDDDSPVWKIFEALTREPADVSKFVIMPAGEIDAALMMAHIAKSRKEAKEPLKPLIAMSMGEAGCYTRVAGELFGSCATFASVAQRSAPGQLDAQETRRMIDELSFVPLEV